MFNAEETIDYAAYEKEMSLYANEAHEALSRIVTKEKLGDFRDLLTFGYNESEQSATNIAESLNLRKIHFLALQDELYLFIDELLLEKECSHEERDNFYIEDFENAMDRY